MDLFQTLLGAAGIASADHGHDGLDLAPLLKDPSSRLDRDALFFHYPHYYHTTTPASAVRARDWKLVEYFEDNRAELYHVSEDISEQQDLAAEMPEKVVELRGLLHAWRESAGAALPRPNPDFKAPVSKPGKSTAAPSK